MEESNLKPNQYSAPGDKGFVNPANTQFSLYANAFTVGQSAADMYMIGVLNGAPSFTVNMSFTAAKHLQLVLNSVIENFERESAHPIPTMKEVGEMIKKQNSTNS